MIIYILLTIGCTLIANLVASKTASKHACIYASKSIYKNNVENVQTLSKILSEAVSDSLQVFGDFALSSVLFASSILNPNLHKSPRKSLPTSILVSEPIYREYNFVKSCQYPKCPQDYGPLAGRSRASKLSNTNGSMEHSSLHLFSSSTKAARNDSAWNRIVSSDTNAQRVINSLGIFDDEFNIMYQRAVNTSVLLYVAASLVYSNKEYTNMMLTYPGALMSNVTFDVWKRDWFK